VFRVVATPAKRHQLADLLASSDTTPDDMVDIEYLSGVVGRSTVDASIPISLVYRSFVTHFGCISSLENRRGPVRCRSAGTADLDLINGPVRVVVFLPCHVARRHPILTPRD
jgi:hypothetical protein